MARTRRVSFRLRDAALAGMDVPEWSSVVVGGRVVMTPGKGFSVVKPLKRIPPRPDRIRPLAEKIAETLMTGLCGKAGRLVLEMPDGTDGGGWGQPQLIDQIETLLRGEQR